MNYGKIKQILEKIANFSTTPNYKYPIGSQDRNNEEFSVRHPLVTSAVGQGLTELGAQAIAGRQVGGVAGHVAGGLLAKDLLKRNLDWQHGIRSDLTEEEKNYQKEHSKSIAEENPYSRASLAYTAIGSGTDLAGHAAYKNGVNAHLRAVAALEAGHDSEAIQHALERNKLFRNSVLLSYGGLAGALSAGAMIARHDKKKYLKFREQMAEDLGPQDPNE